MPGKTPEGFLEIAKRIVGGRVDVLLIHETPYLPSLFPFMEERLGPNTALKAVEIIRPWLIMNGHMHSGGFKAYKLPWGLYIYIDSITDTTYNRGYGGRGLGRPREDQHNPPRQANPMRAKIANLYANPVGGSLYGEVMSFSRPNIDRVYSIPR